LNAEFFPSVILFMLHFLPQIISLLGDLCIVADCERTVKEAVDHFGQLDVLVSLFGVRYKVLMAFVWDLLLCSMVDV
jgi:NAD(P)-dependent dehydrogenase (short-subunit alcohol dehydrogenase family)